VQTYQPMVDLCAETPHPPFLRNVTFDDKFASNGYAEEPERLDMKLGRFRNQKSLKSLNEAMTRLQDTYLPDEHKSSRKDILMMLEGSADHNILWALTAWGQTPHGSKMLRQAAEFQLEASDFNESTNAADFHSERSTNGKPPEADSDSGVPAKTMLQQRSDYHKMGSNISGECEVPTNFSMTTCLFSCARSYWQEGQGTVRLEVMRTGAKDMPSRVCYTTHDVTAKAGVSYEATAGVIEFEPGQSFVEIEVQLLDNNIWGSTVEFMVELLQEGIENATLDRRLFQTQVKVADNDAFPSNKYVAKFQKGDIKGVLEYGLVWEYFKLTFHDPVIRRGSMKIMMVDVLHNIDLIVRLFSKVLLVAILTYDQEQALLHGQYERHFTALLFLIFSRLFLSAALHFCHYKQIHWGVCGSARVILQDALLRRYLQYDGVAHRSAKPGDIIMCLTRDVDHLVDVGYVGMLTLFKLAGQLGTICLFMILAPMIFEQQITAAYYVPLILFPFLLIVGLLLRRKKTLDMLELEDHAQDALVDFVEGTVRLFKLIKGFGMDLATVERFDAVSKKYNQDHVKSKELLLNNSYISPWVGLLWTSLYTMVVAPWYFDEDKQANLSVGMFLGTVATFNTLSHSWGDVYKVLLQITTTIPALRNITYLLSLPTDFANNERQNNRCREMTHALREEYRKTKHAQGPSIDSVLDLLPIRFENVNFSYAESAHSGHRSCNIYLGSIDIEQGVLVAMCGYAKATALNIIGGVHTLEHSSDGTLFVPSHLRMLSITMDPVFFDCSLLDNLTYGTAPSLSEARKITRVIEVCKRLRLPIDLKQNSLPDANASKRLYGSRCVQLKKAGSFDSQDSTPTARNIDWYSRTTVSQRYLVSLARGLIADASVLCVHRPCMHFSDGQTLRIMRVMRHYVDSKGSFGLEDESPVARHFRTCVFSTAKMLGIDIPDWILYVHKRHGMQRHSIESLSESMMVKQDGTDKDIPDPPRNLAADIPDQPPPGNNMVRL